MEKTNYIKKSLLLALATTVYIAIVSTLMIYLDQYISGQPGAVTIILFLLLLVISAAICATLIFAWPVYKMIKGEMREGFKILGITIGWLIVLFILIGLVIIFVNFG